MVDRWKEFGYSILATALLLLVSSSALLAQQEEETPRFDDLQLRTGVYGSYNQLFHAPDFQALPGVPCCSPGFTDGGGPGLSVGLINQYPILSSLLVDLRAEYRIVAGELSTEEVIGNAVNNGPGGGRRVGAYDLSRAWDTGDRRWADLVSDRSTSFSIDRWDLRSSRERDLRTGRDAGPSGERHLLRRHNGEEPERRRSTDGQGGGGLCLHRRWLRHRHWLGPDPHTTDRVPSWPHQPYRLHLESPRTTGRSSPHVRPAETWCRAAERVRR